MIRHGFRSLSFCLAVLLLFAAAANSQTAAKAPLPSNVVEAHLDSKLMGRQMPYRVILPAGYLIKKDARYPVIYLLHGLFGHFDNWTTLSKLDTHASGFDVIIVTPEGGDGWYTDSATVSNDKYESYVIQELIPEIDKKFRSLAARDKRAIAGLSMGGYGALKFGLKFPDKFVLAGSFSGALDGPLRGQGHKSLRPSIMSVFGEEGSETRKDNDIFRIVSEISAEKVKSLPFLYLDCGTDDWLFQPNRDFATLLLEKKVPHEYRQLPGVHEWKYWDRQVQEFLRVANNKFAGN